MPRVPFAPGIPAPNQTNKWGECTTTRRAGIKQTRDAWSSNGRSRAPLLDNVPRLTKQTAHTTLGTAARADQTNCARPNKQAAWRRYEILQRKWELVLAHVFYEQFKSFYPSDDLTRTSEGNPTFSWAIDQPAFSFCVCEGRRELRPVQRHISHRYLVNPSAVHWCARFCPCGDQRL
jgi:hypothetical protein